MGLEFCLKDGKSGDEVFEVCITHNLVPMAETAGVYLALWHPYMCDFERAKDIRPMVDSALIALKSYPEKFTPMNPESGWGSYESFASNLTAIKQAIDDYPESIICSYT